jgi:hypothetical protein
MRIATMESEEAERLCDALAELASKGPSKDPGALMEARSILRQITVDRALSGWFDSDERFQRVLKSHSGEIYALIDRLHSALREAVRFRPR